MRFMKMLGLAVIAAVAAMAFVGASSAAAEPTALCEVDELECFEAGVFPSGTVVKSQLLKQITGKTTENLKNVSPSLLLGPNLSTEIRCYESNASGKTSTGLASPLEGVIETLSFKHCFTKTNIGCTVAINKLGTLTLLKTAANLGAAAVSGVLVSFVCGEGFLRCIYKTESMPMHAKGTGSEGQPGELTASHAKLVEEKELLSVGCPSEGFFDAVYEITSPVTGYITL